MMLGTLAKDHRATLSMQGKNSAVTQCQPRHGEPCCAGRGWGRERTKEREEKKEKKPHEKQAKPEGT